MCQQAESRAALCRPCWLACWHTGSSTELGSATASPCLRSAWFLRWSWLLESGPEFTKQRWKFPHATSKVRTPPHVPSPWLSKNSKPRLSCLLRVARHGFQQGE